MYICALEKREAGAVTPLSIFHFLCYSYFTLKKILPPSVFVFPKLKYLFFDTLFYSFKSILTNVFLTFVLNILPFIFIF